MIRPKVSIVVPVYNLEGDLPKCINSILNQDFNDFELLLINDGSTDNSGEICDHYGLKDDRVFAYHQENSGVSAARNFGLKMAKAEWVCFVDGDDELYPNSLSIIMQEIFMRQPEMVIARSYVYKSGELKNERYKFDHSYLNKNFGGYQLIAEKSFKRGSVCGCFFKRHFLEKNSLSFPLGLRVGEDSIFLSLVHLYVQRISFIDQIFYLINEREGSASRSWSFEKVYQMKANLEFINNYIDENPNLDENQTHILHFSIYRNVSNIVNSLFYCFSITNYFKLLKAVRKQLTCKLNTGDICINKNKIKILNLSIYWFSIFVLSNRGLRQIFK